MTEDIKIAATDVSLVVNSDGSKVPTAISIIGQIVEIQQSGPRRTENRVHLTLTTQQAMALLALLQMMQQRFDLPIHADPVTGTFVPPAKDRN